MRSECQFFMASEDEAEFLAHATTAHPLAISGEGHIAALTCSLGSIQFLRSQRFGSMLTAGRIAIATTGLDGESLVPESDSELERIYRQLRRWLQKRYTNDLVAYSEAFPAGQRKVVRYPSFWLAPHARNWVLSHSDAVLRQFRTGAVVFVPSPSDATGIA
jgi:hypothetical protein